MQGRKQRTSQKQKARIVSTVCLVTFLENGDNQRNSKVTGNYFRG